VYLLSALIFKIFCTKTLEIFNIFAKLSLKPQPQLEGCAGLIFKIAGRPAGRHPEYYFLSIFSFSIKSKVIIFDEKVSETICEVSHVSYEA